jgi:predicted AlkP superfamily pyrophosphatase or phosphodiesterase
MFLSETSFFFLGLPAYRRVLTSGTTNASVGVLWLNPTATPPTIAENIPKATLLLTLLLLAVADTFLDGTVLAILKV